MFRAKTVFVIGAGASYEVGLPAGDDLLKTIVQMTHFEFENFGRQTQGDVEIVEALRQILVEPLGRNDELNAHLRAGRQLGKSAQQALSIDNVIDALEDPKIELLGKLGIVRAILKAEADSPQFRLNNDTRSLDLSNFSKSWYVHLTKLLTEQVKKSEISSLFDNLEIINFNYDRCLEHYLPFSLADYYGVSPDEIRNTMDRLVVHRPYGLTGRLPWRQGDGPAVEFGQGGAVQLAAVVQQIRTFTEQVEEGDQLDAMRAAISRADRLVFLGFAFHRQNVSLISADIHDDATILATTYGISRSDQDVIADELAAAFGFYGDPLSSRQRIDLVEVKCAELFQSYRRTLTAAPPEF